MTLTIGGEWVRQTKRTYKDSLFRDIFKESLIK